MSNPGVDLVNKKVGHLDILERLGKKRGSIYWLCKCKCGKVIERPTATLTRNNKSKTSCGCTYKKTGSNNGRWKGYKTMPASLYSSIKFGAKTRNIEINVSIEDIYNLFIKQHKKCALSGVKLKITEDARDMKSTTASLDRIDSKKPYVKGNIQWVHKDINRMKNALSERRFVNLCKKIVEHKEAS